MSFIKDVDRVEQFRALGVIKGLKKISMVGLGRGRGKTNTVLSAIQSLGSVIKLLNIEPFTKPYIKAHQEMGIKDVTVLQHEAQLFSSSDLQSNWFL